MSHATQPTKQQVRDWMGRRAKDHEPPPTPEEVRRQLGWELIPENKELCTPDTTVT